MGRGCGGGGLRILPHKSWNVYGRKNIEKVRADESVHAESESKLAASSRRNESEWKLQQMRNRVEQRSEQQRGVKRSFSHQGEEEEEDHDKEHPRHRLRHDDGEFNADSEAFNSRSSTTPTAARFVVQQEDDSTAMGDSNEAASSSVAAAPLAPAQHINLFFDAEKTAQNAEINRQKAAEAAQKELTHARKVAPVSLFVESLRDEETLSSTGFDSLRPWYAASEDQREAARIRRVEASKKQVRIKRREDGQGVRLLINRTGEIIHTDVDPLEEMKSNLRQLKQYETSKLSSTSASVPRPTAIATPAPTSHTSLSSATDSVLGIQDVIAVARAQAASRLSSNSASSVTHTSTAVHTNHSTPSVPQQRVSRWSEKKVVSAVTSSPPSDFSVPIRPLFAAASSLSNDAVNMDKFNHPKSNPLNSSVPHKHVVDVISISSASSSSSSSSSSSDSSSNSSSSDDGSSDSDSSSSRKKSRRRSRHRSHKHKKKKEENSEKYKKKKKHLSRSKERKLEKSRNDKRKRSDSKSKENYTSTKSVDSGNRMSTHPSLSTDPYFHPKSLAELRAERELREQTEREKAATLLQVPTSATFDRNSVRQREFRDTEISAKRR